MFPRAKKKGTLPPFFGTLPLQKRNNVEPMRVTGENIRWNITNRPEGSDRKRRKTMTRTASQGTGLRSVTRHTTPRRNALRYARHNTLCYEGNWPHMGLGIDFFQDEKKPAEAG